MTSTAELSSPASANTALTRGAVDTDYSLEDLEEEFGAEVAKLVDGVTKLDKVTYGDNAQAETVRKMIVAMASDIRVLVIKLADRHNTRFLKELAAIVCSPKSSNLGTAEPSPHTIIIFDLTSPKNVTRLSCLSVYKSLIGDFSSLLTNLPFLTDRHSKIGHPSSFSPCTFRFLHS